MGQSNTVPESWTVTRLAGSLGAEVTGVEIASATPDDIAAIKALLLEHMVLFFPGQSPTIEAHVSFGENFGELEGHPNLKQDSDMHPKIFQLKATTGGIADEWHTDITFQENPALMSILHMVKCPPTGGDTMWTNLNRAYEELSAPMKALCEGLTALHDALPHNRPDRMAIHPVVRVHPETGQRALYVNEHFTRRIVEMNATESEMLLNYLTRWVTNPRFTVRYHWTEGTIGMWDNRCTQHFVINDFEGERVIQRVTVMGDKVDGALPPKWDQFSNEGPMSAMSRHDRQLALFLKSQAAAEEKTAL